MGGIKEKVLAAARAKVKCVLLPEHNRDDYEEVPESIRKRLEVHFVSHISEVLNIALGLQLEPPKPKGKPRRKAAPPGRRAK